MGACLYRRAYRGRPSSSPSFHYLGWHRHVVEGLGTVYIIRYLVGTVLDDNLTDIGALGEREERCWPEHAL
jgi:hypothetical protein